MKAKSEKKILEEKILEEPTFSCGEASRFFPRANAKLLINIVAFPLLLTAGVTLIFMNNWTVSGIVGLDAVVNDPNQRPKKYNDIYQDREMIFLNLIRFSCVVGGNLFYF